MKNFIINKEIDFWKFYPKSNRNLKKISTYRVKISANLKKKLKKFPKEYFDGNRVHGYGGYYYNEKFFNKIVKKMIKHYKLNNNSKILDIGCAKGFMMYEFKRELPKCEVRGIDISRYAKKKAHPKIKKFIKVGSCEKLPWPDNFFDFVVSISTIHNLKINGIVKSLKEIKRVSKGKAFIRVKAYNTNTERKIIDKWNIVAESNLHKKKWLNLLKKTKYDADYQFQSF